MIESVASQTAQFTSLMRAIHTRRDPQPIFHDPWGDRLVPSSTIDAIRTRALSSMRAGADVTSIVDDFLRGSAAYTTAITRARYSEDALRLAAGRGIRQYVLIGAGFDSFCLRRDALSIDIEVYELDHAATQRLKRDRLKECRISVPPNVYFIPTDLSTEALGAALSRSTFRRREPAFFSWLGVSMYLTHEANLASLRAIAQCGTRGSELVFTYLDDRVFQANPPPESESFARLWKGVADLGEPFLSGFDPKTLESVLRDAGLTLMEDLGDSQLVERYDKPGSNRFVPLAPSRIALARVVA